MALTLTLIVEVSDMQDANEVCVAASGNGEVKSAIVSGVPPKIDITHSFQ